MSLKLRLTVFLLSLSLGSLLVFSVVIYLTAKKDREREFFALLEREAITKANLFLDAQLNPVALQEIYASNRRTINEVEVAIYTRDFELIYHDDVELDFVQETPEMAAQVFAKGITTFYQDDWQVIGLKYDFNGQGYMITAAAYDEYGFTKLANLLRNMLLLLLLASLILILAAYFFAQQALEPVKTMTRQAAQISAINLDLRLPTKESKDELNQLAKTFNTMMESLQQSFENQSQVVNQISHEIRTPLAAIITELDLALSKKRGEEEYREAITWARKDAGRLQQLTQSLLDLAKASYDSSRIAFKPIRIDEVLFKARKLLLQNHPEYRVKLQLATKPSHEKWLSIQGNEYLLQVAFHNLLDNACKFSPDHKAKLSLFVEDKTLQVQIEDQGPGIPEEDMAHLSKPFFRGTNRKLAEGHGIGLHLSTKIFKLHACSWEFQSTPRGTMVRVSFLALSL